MSENSCLFDAGDDYDKKCGEIFLSVYGYMIFHCTLCEEKFQGFEVYVSHIEKHQRGGNSSNDEEMSDEDCNEEEMQSFDKKSNVLETEECKYDALDETEIMIDNIKTQKSLKVQKSKCKRTTKLEPIVTTIIEIDEDSDSNNETKKNASLSTLRSALANSLNAESSKSQIEIRPIRKKTNYFPDPNEVRPHKCPYCEAVFRNYSSFYKHKLRHQTEKTHPCPQCPKMFYDAIDVKKHQKSHTNNREFLCNICAKTCISSDKLKDHLRRHTNQKDYKCPVCNKAFFNSGLLANHQVVHSTEKPYECNICGTARFKFKKNLTEHMKIHENKREYKCDLCEADFNQLAGLFSHKKTKHHNVE